MVESEAIDMKSLVRMTALAFGPFIAFDAIAADLTIYRDSLAYAARFQPVEIVTFTGSPASGAFADPASFSDRAWIHGCGKPGECGAPLFWIDDSLAYDAFGTMMSSIEIIKDNFEGEYDTSMGVELRGNTEGAWICVTNGAGCFERFDLQGQTGFFGVVSSEPFSSLMVGRQAEDPNPNPHYGEVFYLDSAHLTALVPEPGALALMFAGLLTLGARARLA